MKKIIVFGLFFLVLAFSGCGSSSGGGSAAGFTVTINADPTFGNFPLAVHFSFTCTPSSTTISGCSWAFGDGEILDNEASPSHTYNSAGTKNVTLTVTSSDGKTANASKTITVTSAPTGTITGHISDANTNGDIRNCPVSVTASAGGVNRTNVITNNDGFYTATVRPGTYQVTCPSTALFNDSHDTPYIQQVKSGTVTENQTTTVDFSLVPTLQLLSIAPYDYVGGWTANVVVKYNGAFSYLMPIIHITFYDNGGIVLRTEGFIITRNNLHTGDTFEARLLAMTEYSRVARYTYTWTLE